jgi:hypothetical protein
VRGEVAVAAVDDAGRITHRERERPAAAAAAAAAVPSPAAAHPPSFSHRDDGDGAELSEKGHSVNLRSRLPLLIYASSYGDFWSSTVLRATSRDRHTALCVRMRAPGLGVRTAAAA